MHNLRLTVIIPTYNEAENLPKLVSALFELPLPNLSVMVVDDNSPDGTGKIADTLAQSSGGRVCVIHRGGKQGLGSAYIAGFKTAIAQGAEAVCQMDADFSHPPEKIVEMIAQLDCHDIVLGSRYVPGGAVDVRWPVWRKALSRFGNFYARTILGLPQRDVTGGFRIWKIDVLKHFPLERVRSNGYVFQVELAYLAYLLGFPCAKCRSTLPTASGASARCHSVFRWKRRCAPGRSRGYIATWRKPDRIVHSLPRWKPGIQGSPASIFLTSADARIHTWTSKTPIHVTATRQPGNELPDECHAMIKHNLSIILLAVWDGMAMDDKQPLDNWERGQLYERYVGRWSRQIAPRFLAWLNCPAGLRWLDVGCGTGALCAAILDHCSPAHVIGVEPSEGFLKTARENLAGRAELLQGSATQIPLEAQSVDMVVSGLVLNFVTDHRAALDEMMRVTRGGGMISAYVWDYADKMELMRYFWDAAVALDPDNASLDEGIRFPLCNPNALADLFTAAGLTGAEVVAIDIPTPFASFDDYWQPFLGGQGTAPTYLMSLDADARERLRDNLQTRVPIRPDGSIELIARAWAVKASVTR